MSNEYVTSSCQPENPYTEIRRARDNEAPTCLTESNSSPLHNVRGAYPKDRFRIILSVLLVINMLFTIATLIFFAQLRTDIQRLKQGESFMVKQPITDEQIRRPQTVNAIIPETHSNAEKGVKGARGLPGVRGERGLKGEKGEHGTMGFNGTKGDRGGPGVPGAIGPPGVSGSKGDQGVPGPPGVQGEIGPTGSKGDTGIKGATGEQGRKGEKGADGVDGSSGMKGSDGIPGAPGREGERGEKGDAGTDGINGRDGINGNNGQKGQKGENGRQGQVGPSGSSGAIGPKGSTGAKGVKGSKGERAADAQEYAALKATVARLRVERNRERVRLANGNSNSGRVEVKHNGVWGTVCDDDWDGRDGAVICRMLGFNGVTSSTGEASNGLGSGTIWLDQVDCNGDEEDIEDCPKNSWGTHDCSHGEDASVQCH